MGPDEVLEVLRGLPLSDLSVIIPQVQRMYSQRLSAEGDVSVKSGEGEKRGLGAGVAGGGGGVGEQKVVTERHDLMRRLPTLLLERTWPEAQVALGLQTCKWLRHTLHFRTSCLWRLPAMLLCRVWPPERAVMGIRVCKWLRHRLKRQPPRAVVLQGNRGLWDAFRIFCSFRQFRGSAIHLQWTSVERRNEEDETSDAEAPEYNARLVRNRHALLEGIKISSHVNSNLELVDLSGNKLFQGEANSLLEALAHFSALTHLNLSHCHGELDSISLAALSLLPPFCPALAHLNLSGKLVQWGGGAAKHVCAVLKQTHQLQHLELSQCTLPLEELEAGVLGKISSLSHLDLSQNNGQYDEWDRLPDVLRGCTALTYLNLSNNGLRSSQNLFTVLNDFTNLQTLRLGGNDFYEMFHKAMPEVRRFTALTDLDLSDISGFVVDASKMSVLADSLTECRELRRLNLSKLRLLGPNGPPALLSLVDVLGVACTRLASLDLSSSNLRPETSATLATTVSERLQRCGCLARLYLRDCEMGVEGAAALAAALPLWKKLAVLDIAGNDLGDAGATKVAEVLHHCSKLQVLGLRDNGIDDAGGAELFAAFERWGEAVEAEAVLFEFWIYGRRRAFVDLRQNLIAVGQQWPPVLPTEDDDDEQFENLCWGLLDNEFGVHVRLFDEPGNVPWQSENLPKCELLLQSY